MPCAEMKELETTCKKHYAAATCFERCEATDLPIAETQKLLPIANRAEEARGAYIMLAHRQNCSVCGEKEEFTPPPLR
jgi:hypothetical protein